MRPVGAVACACLSLAVSAGTDVPFITVRFSSSVFKAPEKLAQIVEVNARHPGSCDEYWFALPVVKPGDAGLGGCVIPENVRTRMAEAGITVGFQQGMTLGHGPSGYAEWFAEEFPADVWERDRDGNTVRIFCPRSPVAQDYEADYAASVVRGLGVKSFWMDDDMRMCGWRPDGCFCDRCVAAFNRECGTGFSWKDVVKHVYEGEGKDPVRRRWRAFNAASLAQFAAAARRGVDRVDPTVRVGLQTCHSSYLRDGWSYLPTLKAMSSARVLSGIRAGSGCYFENPKGLFLKLLNVGREAERCRASGFVGTVQYEQENFTREVLHKSPEYMMIESANALAAGCDALTEYAWSPARDEPVSYYEEFAAECQAWRPYLLELSELAKTTRLGGVARFVGSDADMRRDPSIADPTDGDWMGMGVPVTVRDAGQGVYYVNGKSMAEMNEADVPVLLAGRALVDVSVRGPLERLGGEAVRRAFAEGRLKAFDLSKTVLRGQTLPTVTERKALLDALDALKPMPVRMERAHAYVAQVRVDAAGRTKAVTVWNTSFGRHLGTRVRIRRPAGSVARLLRPRQPTVVLEATPGPRADELTVSLPGAPGGGVVTLVLDAASDKQTKTADF